MRTKTDKIFDNKFNESHAEFDSNISFRLEDEITESLEDQVHYEMLFNDIHRIINESDVYCKLMQLDSNDKVLKLSKIQMNDIYVYVLNNISMKYRKMEVFDVLTDYFDIFPAKFYNALNNILKDELLQELDTARNIYKNKKITRLF